MCRLSRGQSDCKKKEKKSMNRNPTKGLVHMDLTLTRLLEREQIQVSTSEYGARVLCIKKQERLDFFNSLSFDFHWEY